MMFTTPSRPAAAFTLLAALASIAGPSALAQSGSQAGTQTGTAARSRTSTTTGTTNPATHRSGAATHTTASADNPPGVPRVTGTPKTLFALRYIDIVTGTGALAEPRKYYTVHYTGWLPDGTKFDSSYDHGGPITFPYGAHQVITGWDTGFEGMHIGGKRRLYIPYQLAYGETGRPPVIPAKTNLIFDVELVSFSENPPPRPEPAAPARPATDPTRPATNPGATPEPTTDPTQPTATPPPPGSSSPSANPSAPPPTQSTTPSTQPSTNPTTNPANR